MLSCYMLCDGTTFFEHDNDTNNSVVWLQVKFSKLNLVSVQTNIIVMPSIGYHLKHPSL